LGEIRLGEMGLGEMGLGEMGQNPAMKPTPVCLVEFHTFSLLNDFCNLHTLCTLI